MRLLYCQCNLFLFIVCLWLQGKWSNAFLNRAFVVQKSHRSAIQPLSAESKDSYKRPSTVKNIIETKKSRWLEPGMVVEYTNTKGSKRFAIIKRIINKHNVEVMVETPSDSSFMIAMYRIVDSFLGNYTVKDLTWHRLATTTDQYEMKLKTLWQDALDPSSELSKSQVSLNLDYIARYLCDVDVNPFRLDGILRILSSSYGSTLFKKIDYLYIPLPAGEVERRQRESMAVKAFQQRWVKLLTEAGKRQHATTTSNILDNDDDSSNALNGLYNEIPIRAGEQCLQEYAQGLIHFFTARHHISSPTSSNNVRPPVYDKAKVMLGLEFLDILKLAPTAKNAKKVLQVMGIWSPYENTDKIVLGLDKDFPQEVLEEANVLMWNQDNLIDPDERIRVNLQYLSSSTYAIDNEYAQEIDDAISIEYLGNGDEKLWIHIADVSRWIRPGCALSLEAERRMSTVYLPDEKISMFPERISSELLSLGAANKPFSFALSVGVVLNSIGEIVSCEICPSTIKVTRRLTYPQINDILETIDMAKEQYAKMLTAQQQQLQQQQAQQAQQQENTFYLRNTTDVVEMLASMKYSTFPAAYGVNSKHTQVLKKNILLARYHPQTIRDLIRLNQWSKIRHEYRKVQGGALDEYLRCKTELMLYVRQQQETGGDIGEPPLSSLSSVSSNSAKTASGGGAGRWQVTGSLTWSNATGISTVSEYMILMSQAIGQFAVDHNVSVIFKTQTLNSPLAPNDLKLQDNETPFLRTLRLLAKMKPANDSKIPGPHITSGSTAYVQCTSPIRRYHDLYNHYRLKHAMHAASLRDQWIENARELAEINKLENMASADERMQRLNIIRQASRTRFAFWLKIYLSRLAVARPKQVLTCIVSPRGSRLLQRPPLAVSAASSDDDDESLLAAAVLNSVLLPPVTSEQEYFVHVLELGSDNIYRLWSQNSLQPGDMLKCHLYKLLSVPGVSAAEKASPYLLLDVKMEKKDVPLYLLRKVIW